MDSYHWVTRGALFCSGYGKKATKPKDKHFESAIGEKIDVKLFEAIDGEKVICGELLKYENKTIYLKQAETEKLFEIEKNKVSQARVTFDM